MPRQEKKRIDKRRAYLSKDFCSSMRSYNLRKLCEEFNIVESTMSQWEEHTNKADIYDIRLHQIADKIKFPKERMFQ